MPVKSKIFQDNFLAKYFNFEKPHKILYLDVKMIPSQLFSNTYMYFQYNLLFARKKSSLIIIMKERGCFKMIPRSM